MEVIVLDYPMELIALDYTIEVILLDYTAQVIILEYTIEVIMLDYTMQVIILDHPTERESGPRWEEDTMNARRVILLFLRDKEAFLGGRARMYTPYDAQENTPPSKEFLRRFSPTLWEGIGTQQNWWLWKETATWTEI